MSWEVYINVERTILRTRKETLQVRDSRRYAMMLCENT